ncbi:hypothetical protein [Shewanella sp. MBTL60-007]|uniref:hypothetical protein n=1 Tax=Shewanella sp. MBTL60-007 TaxID=2815911 RepID=UPI001BC411AF|nr:hypothetical protein [Shewanella sp. MBTL60-007]GIU14202.1 hypothetical protein TUM3792_04790 [Shewanella sp. MBTL60-007]
MDILEQKIKPLDESENLEVIKQQFQVDIKPEKKIHRFQGDLDSAQNAVKIGSSLSSASSILHGFLLIVLALFLIKLGKEGADFYAVIPLLIGAVGILISWAIIYALLSIVVTNALTAKHTIFQSTKN